MEVSGQHHARWLNTQGRNPLYPLYRRLSALQSKSGRCGEEKKILPPLGIRPQLLHGIVSQTAEPQISQFRTSTQNKHQGRIDVGRPEQRRSDQLLVSESVVKTQSLFVQKNGLKYVV
jgi:hypothetical protein